MKKAALLIAATILVGTAIPASAQGVSVRIGDDGYRSSDRVIVKRSRAEYRPRKKVVVIHRDRGNHYGWYKRHHRNSGTVVIHR